MSEETWSAERWLATDRLFQRALELAEGERQAWLESETADDPALRAAVLRLLAAAGQDDDDTLSPGGAVRGALGADLAGRWEATSGPEPGTRIGPYEVVGELGRGGMAVVYRAERREGGFSQQVALKLLKRGTDTDEVLSRFAQERQILAALEHPAIARLYDGGSTAEGQPYLAMELVEGESIDRYCARQELPLEKRLRLFSHVGRAVEHAHRNLVVHRDIKPSNVMVTREGHVKLLDFGIAKLISPEPWHAAAPTTHAHLRLLTPEYASPEQVKGEAVTTATDVYQLGLLLYELLTSKRPFAFEGRSSTEMERLICEQPPPAPSTAWSQVRSGASGRDDELAARTRRRLSRRLKGDLDNIVLKALAKEPSRRYTSAGALVDDLERFLDGLPVEARPASLSYRATKFARRHAWALGGASAVVLVAMWLTALYTVRLARERDRAEQAASKAERVSHFLGSVLGTADPYASSTGPLTARKLLDEGVKRVEAELAGEPDLQAATLLRLGEIYRNLGLMDEARSCFKRSLDLRLPLYAERSLEVAEARFYYASVMRAREVHEAQEVLSKVLEVRREKLGARHAEVGQTLLKLASVARMLGDSAEARRRLVEGQEILEAALGSDHPEVADALIAQASLDESDQPLRGISLLKRARAIRERAFGAESVKVAQILESLADLYRAADKPQEALEAVARGRQIAQKHLEPGHPLFDDLAFEEAKARRDLGQYAEAHQILDSTLSQMEPRLGPRHVKTLMFLEEKVRVLKRHNRPAEALRVSRDYVSRLETIFGPQSPHLALDLMEQADLLFLSGQPRDAREVFDRGLGLLGEREAATLPPRTLQFHARLAADLHHPRAAELKAAAEARAVDESR